MPVLVFSERAARHGAGRLQRQSTRSMYAQLPRLHIRLASSTTTPSPTRRTFGTIATISLVSAVSLGAYTLGSIYPPSTLSLLYPRPAPPPPPDANSPESLAITAALEAELQALPALRALRSQPDANEWYETRPYTAIPEEVRVNKFTSGALRGPGKLALFPLARVKRDESEAIIFIHLGRALCGHDGIVHGGMLATLLDEALGRTAVMNFPDKVGVTATLNLKYKAPTKADQFVVMKTKLVELKGRKAFVFGHVETLDGTVLVEADALFIQPRYAKLLNSSLIRKSMGEPTSPSEPIVVGEGKGGIDSVVPK
ncbi:4HBT domain-containing protein [Favolaschia claudopus]|uniref:4HBT domain-containing protein n=1 Tax=Favolaschia claudopus TaxID=2862362 RepID=A0AAW0CAX7_9AGAR